MNYKVAISVGDTNGIGPEILLRSHAEISHYCHPIYCIHPELLQKIASKLKLPYDKNISCIEPNAAIPEINKGKIQLDSGYYSYQSFDLACKLAEEKKVDFICTLPIHKQAWSEAKIPFIGHTQSLSKRYKASGIMMLGCEKMFVALFSDHIPISQVTQILTKENFLQFLFNFQKAIKEKNIAVLGINPHCGDGGVIGTEDEIIKEAIKEANAQLGDEIFKGPFSADSAFSPKMREQYHYFIAPYHDVGLAPLKALYFDESINITLNIPILRTSVDHGVAFDIAYQNKASLTSYKNAILSGIKIKEKHAKKIS